MKKLTAMAAVVAATISVLVAVQVAGAGGAKHTGPRAPRAISGTA